MTSIRLERGYTKNVDAFPINPFKGVTHWRLTDGRTDERMCGRTERQKRRRTYYAVKKVFVNFFAKFFEVFAKFFKVFASFLRFSRAFRGFRIHSDPLGCIRMHSEAIGSVWTFSKNFEIFWIFESFFNVSGRNFYKKLFSRHNRCWKWLKRVRSKEKLTVCDRTCIRYLSFQPFYVLEPIPCPVSFPVPPTNAAFWHSKNCWFERFLWHQNLNLGGQ